MLVLVIVVLLVVLSSWLVRHALIGSRRAQDLHSALQKVDAAAVRNLLDREDDVFLKDTLPPRYYRVARRARTRAMQQYLLWIASGCASVQLMLRSHAVELPGAPGQAQSLSTAAFRLRIAAFGLWSGLWLQRMFPQFDLMPGSLINSYDKLADTASLYVALPSNHPKAAGSAG
jgi:hypothetical protein